MPKSYIGIVFKRIGPPGGERWIPVRAFEGEPGTTEDSSSAKAWAFEQRCQGNDVFYGWSVEVD